MAHPAHQPPHLDSPGHGRRPPLHTWSCPQLDASDLFSFRNFLPFTFRLSSKDFGVTRNMLRPVPALLVLTLHPISIRDLGGGSGELSVIYLEASNKKGSVIQRSHQMISVTTYPPCVHS